MTLVINGIEDYFETMRRCTRCVLPETFPGITFDGEGICSYCKIYKPMEPEGKEAFQKLLSGYRGKGREYDILVPVSGGRDSCYVLYYIVKQCNMRVKAITVDSGFITEEGFRNLHSVIEKLDIPHVILKNEKRIAVARRNTKIKFRGWVKKPSINTIVPVLNSGDKTMNYQMYCHAREHDIPLVLGGNIIGNASVEQDHWKTGYMGVFPDEKGVYTTTDTLILMVKYGIEYLKNIYNWRPAILSEYAWGAFSYFFDSLRRPRNVDCAGFYDYIYWDEKEILDSITNELNWHGADDTDTTWRIDDSAYPLINYLMYKLVGFTEHDEMYSKMIRENQISRQTALERLEQDHEPRLSKLDMDFMEFEIKKDEIDETLDRYRRKLLSKVLKNQYGNITIR